MINKFSGSNALSQALGGVSGGGMLSRFMDNYRQQQPAGQTNQPQIPEYTPQQYIAPPQYRSFDQLFNQPEFDYSQVGDIYQRGAMPNNLLNRYNSMMQNLQQQQAAMVPRQSPQSRPPRMPYDPSKRPVMGNSQYVNFAQLFGGK
jgi:hypothetical protein